MTHMNIDQARFNMIEQQVRPWEVLDHNVLKVMSDIPREDFMPQQYRELAFSDVEIPLKNGQVILQPRIEGRIMQSLDIKKDDRILEIGTGCGYMTACLASLGDSVVTVECIEELSTEAEKKLKAHGISNVSFRAGDASAGWDQDGPFDVIAITGSMPVVPKKLKSVLHKRGRMFVVEGVAPVMHAKLITRTSAEDFQEEILFEIAIPPLSGVSAKKEFVF